MFSNSNTGEWLKALADMAYAESLPPKLPIAAVIADLESAREIGVTGIMRMDKTELALAMREFQQMVVA